MGVFDGFLNKEFLIFLYFIVKFDEIICNGCFLGKERKNNCNNILIIEKLISGYY